MRFVRSVALAVLVVRTMSPAPSLAAQGVAPAPPPAPPLPLRGIVSVFADGNVKNVIGHTGDATAASGALGLRYAGWMFRASGLVNVAGSSDTVLGHWGASVLAPGVGPGLAAGLLDVRARFDDVRHSPHKCDGAKRLLCNIELHGYAGASTRRWATRSDTTYTIDSTKKALPYDSTIASVRVRESVDVPMWGFGVDVSYAFIDEPIDPSDTASSHVAILLDVGLAGRALRGDLFTHYPDSAREARRTATVSALLDGPSRNFTGPEFSLVLHYNDIRSSLTYYYLRGTARGLAGGQILATVSLDAALGRRLIRCTNTKC